jgi:hypothetical protein
MENSWSLACIAICRSDKAHIPRKSQTGCWSQLTRKLKLGRVKNHNKSEEMGKNYVLARKHISQGDLPTTKDKRRWS